MTIDASIAQLVKQALATDAAIPLDHRGAFVTVADGDGVKAILAHRLTPGVNAWTIAGYVDHPWAGDLTAGVVVQKTW